MKRRVICFVIVCVLGLLVWDYCYHQDGTEVLEAKFFSWIGDAVKGITGLGIGLWGGIKAGKERKKAAKALRQAEGEIEREKAWNEVLFNREYYQDYLQRSEAQAALKAMRDRMKRQSDTAAQKAVVVNATPEAVAKEKELENEAYGKVASAIAANGSQVKDQVMNRYLNYRRGLEGQRMGLYGQNMNLHQQNARQWANLMNNGLSGLTGATSSSGNGDNGLVDVLSQLFKN